MLRLWSGASRILDGRCSCGISPLWITFAVIACGSLFVRHCGRVSIELRLCNLLVELDALQKSPEETRPEIVAGRGSAVFVQKPMVLATTGKPGAVGCVSNSR